MGQLELALQPLLLEVALHQSGVLHRGADLVGHGTHQLPIVQREAVAADPVGQIHDADAAELGARRGIADRHTDEGVAPVAPVAAGVGEDRRGVERIEGHDPLLAKDPGGDRASSSTGTGSSPSGSKPRAATVRRVRWSRRTP